jgi:tRNA A37 threonylcarbamoyladenosine dehydratase
MPGKPKLCYSLNISSRGGNDMPIRVGWGNDQKTYTVFKFDGKWTWEEYHQSIADAYQLVKDCTYTVNILLDITECHLFPQNLLSHVGSSMRQPPKAFDLAVVVSTSRFVEVLARTVEKLYGRQKTRFQLAKSLEEAQQIYAEYDRLHPVNAPDPAAVSESVPVPAAPPSPPG